MAEEGKPALGFEASLSELEDVVKQLESGDLPLEKALHYFEKGIALSEACRKQLEEAETRIEILMKRNSRIEPEPFEPKDA
jgi:exodeoxyribonuclease VII small subunit